MFNASYSYSWPPHLISSQLISYHEESCSLIWLWTFSFPWSQLQETQIAEHPEESNICSALNHAPICGHPQITSAVNRQWMATHGSQHKKSCLGKDTFHQIICRESESKCDKCTKNKATKLLPPNHDSSLQACWASSRSCFAPSVSSAHCAIFCGLGRKPSGPARIMTHDSWLMWLMSHEWWDWST